MNIINDELESFWIDIEPGLLTFCKGFLKKDSEALVASSNVYMLLCNMVKKYPDVISETQNLKSFCYLKSRDYCIKRLYHLHLKKQLSWKAKVKRISLNIWQLITNTKPQRN